MVSASSTYHEAVLKQFTDVTMRLISPDFDHKPWNYSDQFNKYISLRKNFPVNLVEQRFNRFEYLRILLVHHHSHVTFLGILNMLKIL